MIQSPQIYGVWDVNFHGTVSIIMIYVSHSPPTSSDLHPLKVENCDSNSRLVVDEDDNGKFWVERAKLKQIARGKARMLSGPRFKDLGAPLTPMSRLRPHH